ncbi:MAG: RNA polymerase subunit sigma [Verrucomicrobia bacterium]|nr:MAG: RNA polymerase subunit sigma [Verrucomicrobiota bacterium]
MSDVTRILNRVQQGDEKAAEELLPLVYGELRKLAVVRMSNEKPGQTLQPTALVHEAWLKIAGDGHQHFANRRHFFKAAASAMQQILIDIARRKQRLKHGANLVGEELHESRIATSVPSEELLAVNDALAALALEDPQAAIVVQMRYFVGMTVPEIAVALDLAPRTVDRHWAFARAWLKRTIRSALPGRVGPHKKFKSSGVFSPGISPVRLAADRAPQSDSNYD